MWLSNIWVSVRRSPNLHLGTWQKEAVHKTLIFLFELEDIKHPNSLIEDLRHKLHNIRASNVFSHLIQTLMIKSYQKSVKGDKPSYP